MDYRILKPNAKTIVSYLKKGVPLIASVSYAALHDKKGSVYEGHDVVLSGIDGKMVSYIDPEIAKEKTISIDDLMFAIVSRRAIASSAYLIAIEK